MKVTIAIYPLWRSWLNNICMASRVSLESHTYYSGTDLRGLWRSFKS